LWQTLAEGRQYAGEMVGLAEDVFAVGRKSTQHNVTLPSLLPGSEYKADGPDSYRAANLLGQAIAIVVRAEENKASRDQREGWFNLWEENAQKVEQYHKKLAEFRHRHCPSTYSAPDTDREDPYVTLLRRWLRKSLLNNPDWDLLYSLITSQVKPSDKHLCEWWGKLKDICRGAQTSTGSLDPVGEIRNISEACRTREKPAETGQNAKATIVAVIISLIIICIFLLSVWLIPFTPFTWLKDHPNSYGLQGSTICLITCFVLGLFKPQRRKLYWGGAIIAFLGVLLSLLGGPADNNVN